jgi:hypothetical protein
MVIKVACCGGQLVHSNHPHTSLGHPPADPSDSTDGLEYPDRLQRTLGEGYLVANFGAAACFVCAANDAAEEGPTVVYQKTTEASECLAFGPDIVVLGPFGKHDALAPGEHGDYERAPTFTADDWATGMQEMAAQLGATGATIVLALPVPFPSGSTTHALATTAVPATKTAAALSSLVVADTYTPFAGNSSVFPDADHLDNTGTDLLTEAIAETVKAVAVGLAAKL